MISLNQASTKPVAGHQIHSAGLQMSPERAGRGIPSPSRLVCWLVVLLIVTCLRCPSSVGQTPASVNLQVGHDTWTFKDGAPADVVCLAQTKDGFLWLGGPEGLFRFDGMRFEPYSSQFGDRLLSTNLYSLFAPLSGGLWIGYTSGGFSFLDKGRVTNYASETGTVRFFAQDRDGIVWAGTTGGLWRFDHSEWQHIGVEWNVPAGLVAEVGFDSEGILWALVGAFLAPKELIYLTPGTRHFKTAGSNLSVEAFTWKPGRTVFTAPVAPGAAGSVEGSAERLPAAYPITSKNLQMVDRNNSVWVSPTGKTVVVRVPKDSLGDDPNTAPPAGSETYDINPFRMAELVDREGNIWFGDSRGIHRLYYTPLIRQELAKETPGSDFAAVADDNGAVWISFNSGNTLEADLFHVLGSNVEHRFPQVTSSFAYRAPDKTFWFSGKGCLWHLVGRDFIRVDLPSEMVNQSELLQTIAEDQQGGIWVSFGRLSLYRLANGSWTPFGGRNDLPKTGRIMVAFTDSLGRVWFGNVNGQLAVLEGDRVRVFRPGDDLQVGKITAIYGRGPEIWIGGEFGLEQFDHERFHKIAAWDDQWLRGITGIAESPEGDLWLNAISGIFHIRKAEISEALKDSAFRVKGEHFDRREGLSGIPSQVHPLPTAIEGSDGRLWFTLRNGVVWLDPTAYSEKRTVPPPITIQSVSADDKGYAPDSRLSLPAHTSSLQISYTAVSLSDPEAIRFRYKLQETDKGWHEATAATPVTYRNLPPDSYHFSVEASDTNGVWSGAPANMAFTILPVFYQTLWFRSLCMILFLTTLAGLYQLRLRQLARQYGLRLEERVSERTRIARDLHDTLLQSFQGLLLRFQTAYALFDTRPSDARDILGSSIDQTAQAITEGREAVQGLRASTVESNDLAQAITTLGEQLAAEASSATSVGLHVEVEGSSRNLHPIVSDEIYRIASEALRNAFRHAQARQIEVEFRYDQRQLRMRVRDDGKGIDATFLTAQGRAGHFGLHGMRERAKLMGGKLTVWTAAESGTEIELLIPATRAYAAPPRRSWFAEQFSGKSVQSKS
jgi:signal transduction histidine kinase/ligand-binding sensor domain-containing protein